MYQGDLDAKDAFSETDLEQAIMDHLQEFLLEMGKGLDGDNPPTVNSWKAS